MYVPDMHVRFINLFIIVHINVNIKEPFSLLAFSSFLELIFGGSSAFILMHFLMDICQASDVLAVELLQKDARLSVSGQLGRPCPGKT